MTRSQALRTGLLSARRGFISGQLEEAVFSVVLRLNSPLTPPHFIRQVEPAAWAGPGCLREAAARKLSRRLPVGVLAQGPSIPTEQLLRGCSHHRRRPGTTVIRECIGTVAFPDGCFPAGTALRYPLPVTVSYRIVSSGKNFHRGNQRCVCAFFQKLKSTRSHS